MVSGVPSLNFTPLRILNVQVFAPFDDFQLVAMRGARVPSAFWKQSHSPTCERMNKLPSEVSHGAAGCTCLPVATRRVFAVAALAAPAPTMPATGNAAPAAVAAAP